MKYIGDEILDNLEMLAMLDKKLNDHIIEYEKRQLEQDLAYKRNMEAIAELTKATTDIVDAWKLANGFQKFIKWLSGFVILGTAMAWLTKHFN